MGQCPFCQQKIEESLLRFGGPCPHCFNQIPGDEAATDPGAALRAKEQAAEAARRRKRQLRNGALAAVVLLSLSGGGWWAYQERLKQEQVLLLDFDDEFFRLGAEEFAALYAVAEEPPPTEAGKATRSPKPPRQGSGEGDGVVDAGVPDRLATEAGDASGPTQTSMGATPAGPGGLDFSGLGSTGPERRGATLTDPVAIEEMIKTTVKRNRPQILSCYNGRLKETPDLQGVWDLTFNVSTAGKATDIQVKGKGVSDDALEACIARNVGAWNFSPINKDFPVKYPLKLKSGG